MTDTVGLGSAEICRYEHRAMATVFEVLIAEESPTFAEQAAFAAFQEIDRLEQELSRYLPNSDIARINNLTPPASLRVGLNTFECLRIAKECWRDTGGAFDVTVGSLVESWRGRDRTLRHPSTDDIRRALSLTGMPMLELDERTCEVRISVAALSVDLGAIGKGYAVDKACDVLRDWGVASAMVHGGGSSVYAFGNAPEATGWPVTLTLPAGGEEVPEKVYLCDRSLSGSGIRNAAHIIDPRTGQPVRSRRAAWACARSAARSDAVSTACMIMTRWEIEQYCRVHSETWVVIVEVGEDSRAGEVVRFGDVRTA